LAAGWFLSTSILMIFAFPLTYSATSFRIGLIILHGPHHSAKKSTKTGWPVLIISLKFAIIY
jgi:hypothetical protein